MSGTGSGGASAVKAAVGGILLGGINGNAVAVVAKLTTLGGDLAGEELDNFNTGVTVFSETLQANGGDWNGAFQAAFGPGTAFQNTAKSDALSTAIQVVAVVANFIQAQVNAIKGLV